MADEPSRPDNPTAAGRDEPVGNDAVVGEARWPMVGAVLAAIVLTILLPEEVRLGPRWLLPLLEGILLVAVIVGDPITISRRSRLLRKRRPIGSRSRPQPTLRGTVGRQRLT